MRGMKNHMPINCARIVPWAASFDGAAGDRARTSLKPKPALGAARAAEEGEGDGGAEKQRAGGGGLGNGRVI